MPQLQENFYKRVYRRLSKSPKAKWLPTGRLPCWPGSPRAARVVGYALHVNPSPGVIPCHRVVNREGKMAPAFAFGGPDVQRQMLEQEGVVFSPDGTVDLKTYLWRP